MQLINVTEENIAREHICCAITEKKGESCVADKKAWMMGRFAEGLVFTRLDARGKVFIEYVPAENAWCPVDAPGYMYINCFWVAGQFKGKGYGTRLLESCMTDAKDKGMRGLVIVSSAKKKAFLSEGKFLKKRGFMVADTAEPYFELLYLPFEEGAPVPSFRPQAKTGKTDEPGVVLYYTDQCPFAHTYAQKLTGVAERLGRPVTLHRILTAAEAQQAPTPHTTYSLYIDGQFITQEILTEGKFEALLAEQ